MNVTNQFVINYNSRQLEPSEKPYIGKVRKVTNIGYGYLMLSASDRLSSFDRYICDIPGKGCVLNNMSKWWFNNTTHIIDNHYVYRFPKIEDLFMIVPCCHNSTQITVYAQLTQYTNFK